MPPPRPNRGWPARIHRNPHHHRHIRCHFKTLTRPERIRSTHRRLPTPGPLEAVLMGTRAKAAGAGACPTAVMVIAGAVAMAAFATGTEVVQMATAMTHPHLA